MPSPAAVISEKDSENKGVWGNARTGAGRGLRPGRGRPIIAVMERNEWLKVIYEAACQVAEKHGAGLRSAVESKDDAGALAREIGQVASELIAANREIWPFIKHSAHPEPPGDEWRQAGSFEGALVHAAVAAAGADMRDVLEALAVGRVPSLKDMKPSDAGGGAEG